MTNLITSFVGKELFVCKENYQKCSVCKRKGYSENEKKRDIEKNQLGFRYCSENRERIIAHHLGVESNWSTLPNKL